MEIRLAHPALHAAAGCDMISASLRKGMQRRKRWGPGPGLAIRQSLAAWRIKLYGKTGDSVEIWLGWREQKTGISMFKPFGHLVNSVVCLSRPQSANSERNVVGHHLISPTLLCMRGLPVAT